MQSQESNKGSFSLTKLLEKAQESSAFHAKFSAILRKELQREENDFDSLMKLYINCLYTCFMVDFKTENSYVNRILQFTSLVCSELSSGKNATSNLIVITILEFLLQVSEHVNDSVRYWALKLFTQIFNNMQELDKKMEVKIQDSLLESSKDLKAVIRYQAIPPLRNLQVVEDPECPVVARFLQIMSSDPNAKLRRVCTEKIALLPTTLPDVIRRVRDVDGPVRIAALNRLCCIATCLKIEQRRQVLRGIYYSKCDKVKEFASKVLLPKWLESYKGDVFKFLRSFKYDACEEDIQDTSDLLEKVLESLFQEKSVVDLMQPILNLLLEDTATVDVEKLDFETSAYYRFLTNYLRTVDENLLHRILPEDLTTFCSQTINNYCRLYLRFKKNTCATSLEYLFVLQQLFRITLGYDVSDSYTRQQFNSFAKHVLQNSEIDCKVVEVIVQKLNETIPGVDDRCTFINEIIDDIRYGFDAQYYENLQLKADERRQKLQTLHNDLSNLKNEQITMISEARYDEAAIMKERFAEVEARLKSNEESEDVPTQENNDNEKTDVPTILRYLSVAEGFLKSPQLTIANQVILSMTSDLFHNLIVHPDDEVKEKAFACYGLVCIIDQLSAKTGILLFTLPIFGYQNGEECSVNLLSICISATCDLLRMHGAKNLIAQPNADEEEIEDGRDNLSGSEDAKKIFTGGTSLTDIMNGFGELLNDNEPKIQLITTKALASILLDNIVHSKELLSLFILKWANPLSGLIHFTLGFQNLKKEPVSYQFEFNLCLFNADPSIVFIIGTTLERLPRFSGYRKHLEAAFFITIEALVYAPKTNPLADVQIDRVVKFMLALISTSPFETDIHKCLGLELCCKMNAKPNAKVNLIYSKVLLMLNKSHLMEEKEELTVLCDQIRDNIKTRAIEKNIIKFVALLTSPPLPMGEISEEAVAA